MSLSHYQIMIIDDDQTIAETVSYNLKRNGYDVIHFAEGKKALAQLDAVGPALIILDWMLPDITGPEICKVIRTRTFDVPILMLTGRASPNDIAIGLTSGADDYLTKPFSSVEFIARVQALLRRSAKKRNEQTVKIELGSLLLDENARRVTLHNKPIELSPKEFALLKVFMLDPGKTFSTEELLNSVWGVDFVGDTKTVAVHIRWLRQKLEKEPKHPKLLETVNRSGYRFNAPTDTLDQEKHP